MLQKLYKYLQVPDVECDPELQEPGLLNKIKYI